MSAVLSMQEWYARTPERAMVKVHLLVVRPITTGMAVIPIGTRVSIERKFGGLNVLTDKCSCCGVQLRARKVAPDYFQVLVPFVPRGEDSQ